MWTNLKWAVLMMALCWVMGGVSICSAAGAAKLPDLIIFTSYDVGTSTYMQTACMADGITKKTGMKVRVLPSGNDMSRILPLRSKTAHFATTSAPSCFAGMNGFWDFAKYDWGPQAFRQVLSVIDYDQGIVIGTAASANIKTLKDLKGKRLTWIPGGPALNSAMEATLAFAGLTWNDVIKVPAPSLGTSMKFLGEGKADAAWSSTTSPVMFEVERSPHGVYWPEYPPEDKAGWERLHKIAPYFIPTNATKGVGVSKTKPRKLATYAYPIIIAYDTADENTVYEVTKAIDVSFDLSKRCHDVMPCWEFKKAINLKSMLLPYHPGTIRYLKEKGLWSKEMEKRQNQLIQEQTSMKKLWDAIIIEAKTKNISDEGLADFWAKKRAAASK
ncbi:MAG: TAXI family TRAP transporter solute-binding subunit [Syntrophales bacterium]